MNTPNKSYLIVRSADIAAAEPACFSNITDTGYSVLESDFIVISCEVEFSGNLSPVITCLTDIPGHVAVTEKRQALSRFVVYQKVVAVSAGLNDKQLSCSISFTDLANNRSGLDLLRSIGFNWFSPRIHVIHNGKYYLP